MKNLVKALLVIAALYVGYQVLRGVLLSTGKDSSTEQIDKSTEQLRKQTEDARKKRESP